MPGPLLAPDAGEVRAMVEESVDQGVRLIARSGMHDQPGRLVQNEEVFVFKKNRERDLLRLVFDLLHHRLDQPNDIASPDCFPTPRHCAVEEGVARLDQRLETGPGKLRQCPGEVAIETLARLVVRHG